MADHIFELFAKPLRVALLAELTYGPRTRSELLANLGAAPSTLDALLNELEEADLIARERSNNFPTQTTVSLTSGAGKDLAAPLDHAARWLTRAGLSPLQAQDPRTVRVASHLSWNWRHRLIDLLAIGPMSATRLVTLTDGVSANSIQAHLRELAVFGIVDVSRPTSRGANRYVLSHLGHSLVGALAAFVRWELRHHEGSAGQLTDRDVATAIRMACSLIDPSEMRPGRYAFIVNLADGRPAGLVVDFDAEGWRSVVNPSGPVRYGIRGDPPPWLDAVLDLKTSPRASGRQRLTIVPHDCNFIELVHGAISVA